jgi:hypothetical protein
LTDLLMEVDSWTGISKYFTHLYTQQPASDRTLVFTVILSDATNIGLTKIADATPRRSYARLSWVADWYVQHSELALALRELGRVERTLFTLDWLRQPELRRRANTGLNKGELRNALAKALRFYRRGAVADRDREEQQRVSATAFHEPSVPLR